MVLIAKRWRSKLTWISRRSGSWECWTGTWQTADTCWKCGWIAARSWSSWRWHNGQKSMVWCWNLSGPASPRRMPLSDGSTGRTGQKYWIFIYSEPWMKHGKSHSAGWLNITASALTSHWTTWHLKSTGWWLKSHKVRGTKTGALTVIFETLAKLLGVSPNVNFSDYFK